MSVLAWLVARPKLAIAILLTLALVCWHWQDEFSDWWDGRKIDRVTEQRDTARAERDVARADAATGDKAAVASTAARNQNDEALPRVRAATAARIDRTGADVEQLRRDEVEAAADYRAAADRLRGTGAR